jgi:hypothetical protein
MPSMFNRTATQAALRRADFADSIGGRRSSAKCSRNRLLLLPAVKDNAAMQTEPSKAEPPKRKRRWFQFSLRR